ncbi:hypothetical protein CRENBAI_010926 [Crenichthys baileyi]|uniref:Uncharacterized protein n=1 Tax=Crenichthys baileyi TaxID=28760 RepID=A0AAV9STE6_9TELE
MKTHSHSASNAYSGNPRRGSRHNHQTEACTRKPTPPRTLSVYIQLDLSSPPPEEASTPDKVEPVRSVRSDHQECGPTPKKRADQSAQCNKNTLHRGGHMTNMPNHARTHEAKPTKRNTTAWHRAEDRTQQRAPKVTAVHKAHTVQMHPRIKKTQSIQTQEHMPNTHTVPRSSPARKPPPKATKGREPTEPEPKPTEKARSVHPEINHADHSDLSPRRHWNQHQKPEPRKGTTIRTGTTQTHLNHSAVRPARKIHSLKESAPAMRWYLPASLGGP